MRVRSEDIDPALRGRARVFRFLSAPARSEAQLRKSGGLIGLMRHLPGPRGLLVETRWVGRPDGSRLRLKVYRAGGSEAVAASSAGPASSDGPASSAVAASSAEVPADGPASSAEVPADGPASSAGSASSAEVPADGVPARPGVAGIIWLHGGGYVLGSPEQDSASYRRVIEATGGVIVAPDYRLAPEAPYPAALDDCALALRWLRDNAPDLGVRVDQLAVAGNSAGGGLAAALTLRERDLGEVAIAFQMPLYPMLDDRCVTASALDNDGPVWDSITNRNAWKVYLGDLSGTDDVPAYAAPARATDLSGLPPAFTYVGGIEPFSDEVVAYVERLRAAGVPVEFEVVPGAYHGFDVVAPSAPVSRRMLEAQSAWLRMAVRTWFAPQPGRGSRS